MDCALILWDCWTRRNQIELVSKYKIKTAKTKQNTHLPNKKKEKQRQLQSLESNFQSAHNICEEKQMKQNA